MSCHRRSKGCCDIGGNITLIILFLIVFQFCKPHGDRRIGADGILPVESEHGFLDNTSLFVIILFFLFKSCCCND